jgi:MOSC domain-containing protein YiiM
VSGVVVAVSLSPEHGPVKLNQDKVTLLQGRGVDGDAHLGAEVQHRSRARKDPSQANLRQVHLLHEELHDELKAKGFGVVPGVMGENVTTRGIDLLGLPPGAVLRLGDQAVVEITGLRNPCYQLDWVQKGLMKAVLDRDDQGNLVRKAGVMSIVLEGGEVQAGDEIVVELPPEPHEALPVV